MRCVVHEMLRASLTAAQVDIGLAAPSMELLSQSLNCNVCVYDYSGYGLSTGAPREANLYADIDAVFSCLTTKRVVRCMHLVLTLHRFGIAADRIILYGQSIGTVPTVDLASRVVCAGVVLHSPLASGLRVLRPTTTCNLCCDPFPSITKIGRVQSPVLFIHGERVRFCMQISRVIRAAGPADPHLTQLLAA